MLLIAFFFIIYKYIYVENNKRIKNSFFFLEKIIILEDEVCNHSSKYLWFLKNNHTIIN